MSRKADDHVGHYVKEAGYEHGKPPLKMPGSALSGALSEEELAFIVERMQAAAAAPSEDLSAAPPEDELSVLRARVVELDAERDRMLPIYTAHLEQQQRAAEYCEKERLRVAALTEHELHREQRHPDYEYLTTENARKQSGGDPPDNEGWEPNEIVLITNGLHGPDDPPRYRNWERFEFTETNYWRRRKPTKEIT